MSVIRCTSVQVVLLMSTQLANLLTSKKFAPSVCKIVWLFCLNMWHFWMPLTDWIVICLRMLSMSLLSLLDYGDVV